jgi:hypothetical protein
MTTTAMYWLIVAAVLGEDEDRLDELSIDMFPEGGCLHVYGVVEGGVIAFSSYGIECLHQVIEDERKAGQAPPRANPAE